MTQGIQYTFVVPIYNDGMLADAFCLEFKRIFSAYLQEEQIENYVELIFVNDGSKNNSMTHLKDLVPRFGFVKVIELSRNFGQHIALSCGYKHAKGNYVGMLNVDMEDPPSEIPGVLRYFNDHDVDIVIGVREKRGGSFVNSITSKFFNYFLNKLTGYEVPLNVATLRVMNRKFTDAYNALTEKSRFIPGLENWLGFRHGYYPISHKVRKSGQSSYTLKKRLLMAIDSVLSFSDLPLKWITFFGFLTSIIGFIMVAVVTLQKIFFVDFQAGYVSTLAVIVLFSGIQILVVGTSSLYIGRILREVQNRPLYVIRNTYNF